MLDPLGKVFDVLEPLGMVLMCLNKGRVFYFLYCSLGSPLINCVKLGNLEMFFFFERKIFLFYLFFL